MRRLQLTCFVFASMIMMPSHGFSQAASSSPLNGEGGRHGALDGVWLWSLPETPNGLRPTQSWHATGSSPEGDIYVAGMDHKTDAALYRLHWREGKLQFVGDARSASEAVSNWMEGETAEKFHTRPLWHDGRVYVATMNRSTLDDGYLTQRGFHWYSYDPTQNRFSDLSASEPNGTAVDHGNVVTLASDPSRNLIYGAGVPTGEIYRYRVSDGRTDRLGRPTAYNQRFVYTGRVMWVDTRGRLYFTASNSDSPSVFGHIYYYDPDTGFGERKDWHLQDAQALEVGQCVASKRYCFFSDDKGHIYRFDDDGPSWSYVGQIETGQYGYMWLFDLDADESKVYAAISWPSEREATSLFEFDLKTGKTLRLCAMADLDPALQDLRVHTGYDAWDADGRFYFASFSGRPDQSVVLTRIDPKWLKAALRNPGSGTQPLR